MSTNQVHYVSYLDWVSQRWAEGMDAPPTKWAICKTSYCWFWIYELRCSKNFNTQKYSL